MNGTSAAGPRADSDQGGASEHFGARNASLSSNHGPPPPPCALMNGRRPPSWSIGMIEASLFLEVDFSNGPLLVSGTSDAAPFFDRLVAAVRERNPLLERPR